MNQEHLDDGVTTAIDFLKTWKPEGPWILTAITTEKKLEARSFQADELDKMKMWLSLHQGEKNIYFQVNSTRVLGKTKIAAIDVASMDWLHVDVDPKGGADIAEEQERIRRLFTTDLPVGVPKPTCIVYSGGGYQAFWKLKQPMVLDGTIAKADEAKGWNIQLETIFGGDSCHNIDRIMRLPGTVNLPDEKKRAKGRVAAMSSLIDFSADHSYSLSEFIPFIPVQDPKAPMVAPEIVIPGNNPRVDDLELLAARYSLSSKCRFIISDGTAEETEGPKPRDNSGSAWLLDALCEMSRKGVPVEVVYSIITDPDWKISDGIRKAGNPDAYAKRQIARAEEFAKDPELQDMNEKHCFIRNHQGKCRIAEFMEDPMTGTRSITLMGKGDFINSYSGEYVEVPKADGNMKKVKKGQWWFDHPEHTLRDDLVFAPNQDFPNLLNTWQGYKCQALPPNENRSCEMFLTHVLENVCGRNQEHYDYLLKWMARAVQRPEYPGEVAVVMRGGRGTGKSFFAKHFGYLFGPHYKSMSNSMHLTGKFNSHLSDAIVVFADEAFFAGDPRQEPILKTLITESMMITEKKGYDAKPIRNCTHLIMASNADHVVPAGHDERRFFVLDVAETHKQDSAYFGPIVEQLEAGGYEALLYTLMNLDLKAFNVRTVPQTQALIEQKFQSTNAFDEWWNERLVAGRLREGESGWEPEIRVPELVDLVQHYIQKTRRNGRQMSAAVIGKFLKKATPRRESYRKSVEGIEYKNPMTKEYIQLKGSHSFYLLPSLKECRDFCDTKYGRTEWPEE